MAEEKTVETFKTFENEETLRDKDLITYYKLRLLEIKQKQGVVHRVFQRDHRSWTDFLPV